MTKQELIEKYTKIVNEHKELIETNEDLLRRWQGKTHTRRDLETAKYDIEIYKSVLHDLGEMQ